MGVLLSICFKSKEQQANPQHQVKQKRGNSKRQQAGSKQHLLSEGPSLFGYNAQANQSPPPYTKDRRPSWGKPPPSPQSKDDGKDPPEFFSPPSPVNPDMKKERDNKNKKFQLSRTISLTVPGKEDNSPKRKRSVRGRKGSTRKK